MEIKKAILFISLVMLCFFSSTVHVKASGVNLSIAKSNTLILADSKAKSSPAKEKPKIVQKKSVPKSVVKDKSKGNFLTNFFSSMNVKKLIIIIVILIAVILLIIIAFLILGKKGKTKNDMIHETEKPSDIPPLAFGNAQNIGRRDDQQDSFGISDCDDEKLVKEKGVFAIVADGMGGLDNGKVSSSLVVESMMRYFAEKPFISVIPIELRNMLVNANNELLRYLSGKGKTRSGSTAVSEIIKDSELYWISVGDSRIYLYRNKRLFTINRDHVYGTELLQKAIDGKISFEEAMSDPDRKALTSYMGIDEITEIDQNIKPFRLQTGDKIILCSDGVYGSLKEAELAEAMDNSAQDAAFKLEEKVLAKSYKGQDNMTAVVIAYNGAIN